MRHLDFRRWEWQVQKLDPRSWLRFKWCVIKLWKRQGSLERKMWIFDESEKNG